MYIKFISDFLHYEGFSKNYTFGNGEISIVFPTCKFTDRMIFLYLLTFIRLLGSDPLLEVTLRNGMHQFVTLVKSALPQKKY